MLKAQHKKKIENSIFKLFHWHETLLQLYIPEISYSLTVFNAEGILSFITMGFTDIKGFVIYSNW